MSHEPECPERTIPHSVCICQELSAAYGRGRDYERKMIALDHLADLAHSDEMLEAAYQRGREDAAKAAEVELRKHGFYMPAIAAIAAARGNRPNEASLSNSFPSNAAARGDGEQG